MICYGFDVCGNLGYFNFIDVDWLYGGFFDKIVEIIINGCGGMMLFMGIVLGEDGVRDVVMYIFSFIDCKGSGNVVVGKVKFDILCVVCYGVDVKGN